MPPFETGTETTAQDRREPPPGQGPDLDEPEKKKADEEESLNASITYEVIRREGEKELERSPYALAWSGLAGGLSMGFILIAKGLLYSHLPDAAWRPLVTNLGYAVGFLIVILGSQQLYTENTLTPIVPLLTRKTGDIFARVMRLWGIVLVTNLLGTIVFGWAVAWTTLFEPEVHEAFLSIAREALRADFATTFVRAIFAGWIIALMVWMLPAAHREQVPVIVVMTYLVGVSGLAHIIAGSTEVAYLVARGVASWGDYFGGFVLPTLLGNTLGGVTLVAALNHAQVVRS